MHVVGRNKAHSYQAQPHSRSTKGYFSLQFSKVVIGLMMQRVLLKGRRATDGLVTAPNLCSSGLPTVVGSAKLQMELSGFAPPPQCSGKCLRISLQSLRGSNSSG